MDQWSADYAPCVCACVCELDVHEGVCACTHADSSLFKHHRAVHRMGDARRRRVTRRMRWFGCWGRVLCRQHISNISHLNGTECNVSMIACAHVCVFVCRCLSNIGAPVRICDVRARASQRRHKLRLTSPHLIIVRQLQLIELCLLLLRRWACEARAWTSNLVAEQWLRTEPNGFGMETRARARSFPR